MGRCDEAVFRHYLEELTNWKDFMSLKAEGQAPAVIKRRNGEPQRVALNIRKEDRIRNNGLETLISKLEVYPEIEEQDLYFYCKQLRMYRRTSEQSISDFIGGFTHRADKLKACKDVDIPQKLLEMMMIDHASLNHGQESKFIWGLWRGSFSYESIPRT